MPFNFGPQHKANQLKKVLLASKMDHTGLPGRPYLLLILPTMRGASIELPVSIETDL